MRFWNFYNSADETEVELVITGEIATEKWWGDETTPNEFLAELSKCKGKTIRLTIDSPGGDVLAASKIYTALVEHTGKVICRIDSMAASAASVIAMAGEVHMSPTALLMIHDPMTVAWGNKEDLKQSIKVLDEVKETIINAYEIKSGLPRDKIAKLMTDETWMSSKTAIELGFCDKEIESNKPIPKEAVQNYQSGVVAVWNCVHKALPIEKPKKNTASIIAKYNYQKIKSNLKGV